MCTTDRNKFLTKYTNKENFVAALAAKLEANVIKVVLCPSDAETTIVRVAMEYENRPVTVFFFFYDTDILCLPLHNLYILRDHGDILDDLACKNDAEVRSCYLIQNIIDTSENVNVEYILFCHTFTGCSTISVTHMFGKTFIFIQTQRLKKIKEYCR